MKQADTLQQGFLPDAEDAPSESATAVSPKTLGKRARHCIMLGFVSDRIGVHGQCLD